MQYFIPKVRKVLSDRHDAPRRDKIACNWRKNSRRDQLDLAASNAPNRLRKHVQPGHWNIEGRGKKAVTRLPLPRQNLYSAPTRRVEKSWAWTTERSRIQSYKLIRRVTILLTIRPGIPEMLHVSRVVIAHACILHVRIQARVSFPDDLGLGGRVRVYEIERGMQRHTVSSRYVSNLKVYMFQ